MGLCHGHMLSGDSLTRLYDGTKGDADLQWGLSRLSVPGSGPIHPSTLLTGVDKSQGRDSSLDLRQAVMQLQYLCQRRLENMTKEEQARFVLNTLDDGLEGDQESQDKMKHKPHTLREATIFGERRSYCDAYLSRPFDRACEVSHSNIYGGKRKTE